VLGINLLGHLTQFWSAGGEVYYTDKEKSGGVSCGIKFETEKHCATFVGNPIMGHFSAAYTVAKNKLFRMATRYDLNIFSYDSDLSFGIEFAPEDEQQRINASVSLENGIAFRYESYYKQLVYSIGLGTSFGRNPVQNFGLHLEIPL
jgi:distribution and morphology protein 10